MLFVPALRAQTSYIDGLLRELEDTIRRADLVKAADLASKLDDNVQRQFRASLTNDATERVAEVLAWLAADTEAMFVLQEPIVIKATDAAEVFAGRPAQLYAVDRLMALNGGTSYHRLAGRTIRLTVAGIGNIGQRAFGGVPSVMPNAHVTYFYFFSEPLNSEALGAPDELVASHPLWRATARVDAGEPWRPGIRERALREDENWVALLRPDLLVVSSRREIILHLLDSVDQRNPPNVSRALPENMPEWAEVNRRATFWGLRYFSEPGKRGDSSNPRTATPDQPLSDPLAIGVTVGFDTESGALEIRYLSGAHQAPRVLGQFQIVLVRDGMFRLSANTHQKGDFPFHFAAELLGFGGYR